MKSAETPRSARLVVIESLNEDNAISLVNRESYQEGPDKGYANLEPHRIQRFARFAKLERGPL